MKKKILIAVPVVILALLAAGGWIFSGMVLYPHVECNKEHHVYCATPGELGLAFEEFSVSTKDGLTLPGWYVPAAGSDAAIVFVHGHGGMRNEGLRYAKALHRAGFNLVFFDLRRNVPGGFASMGFHEKDDVKAAVKVVHEKYKNRKVGLFGFSMGAATGILSMAEDRSVDAGLFSSGYASAKDVLLEAAKRDYGLPQYPLFPFVEFFIDLRGGMKISEVQPENRIGEIAPRPVLLFHCDQDDYVASSHLDRLLRQAKEPRDYWIASCNRHERIWNTYPVEAEDRAVQFFTRNLKGAQ